MKNKGLLAGLLRGAQAIWLPIALVITWYFASANSEDPFLPPLQVIWDDFVALWIFQNVPIHVVPSLTNLFTGLFIGVSIGLLTGVFIGTSARIAKYVEPTVDFIRSIPPVATVPVFIMIFGLESQMRIAAIAFSAIFPTMLAVIQGMHSNNKTMIDTAKVFRLSKFQTLFMVRVPAASPIIFSGIQVSLQVAFVVTIASELLGSGFGIGAFTLIATDMFMIVDAWTGVILMGILGFAINYIFDLVERRVLRWYLMSKKLA
jgi:ABC-type nitrate/sulfonate/bicarbonate transport system permease component